MANEKQPEQTLALFRELIERQKWPATRAGVAANALANREAPTAVTTPHPYYLVSGTAVLEGRFSGAETLTGYQSIVLQGGQPVGAPIAAPSGEDMSYAASWGAGAAEALNEALQVAEQNGRDASDFAVVTVPEAGFSAVWLRDRHELVPIVAARRRSALDPHRIYTEEQVIELLHNPLSKRLRNAEKFAADSLSEKPPTG